MPRLAEGRALGPRVHAMADVSDGLLIDAARMGAASGVGIEIDLDAVPLADGADGRVAAVTAGDDYELLFAAPPGLTLDRPGLAGVSAIGRCVVGEGLVLFDHGRAVPLPAALGYEHGASGEVVSRHGGS